MSHVAFGSSPQKESKNISRWRMISEGRHFLKLSGKWYFEECVCKSTDIAHNTLHCKRDRAPSYLNPLNARHPDFHMTPYIYTRNTGMAGHPVPTNPSGFVDEAVIALPAVKPVLTNVAFDHKQIEIVGLPADTVELGSRHLPNVPKQRWARCGRG